MAVKAALRNHATHILQWLNYIPQTNEIRRYAVLVVTALIIERRLNLPLIVSELGASAGLNLLFDRFALSSFGFTYQPHKAKLTLTPDWRGPAPPPGRAKIAGRSGVNLSPIYPRSSEGFLRLCAYTWPDQTERRQQLGVFAPRSALPSRKVMQLIGFVSGSQRDILSISIWSSTQSRGNIFLSKRNKTAGKRQKPPDNRQAAQPQWHIFQWKLIAKV